MYRDKQKNMAMLTIAAAILVATNGGVWLAAQEGLISPVGNPLLWGAFVVLNLASILWAVVLLGLQPVVVSLSYLAGGFLAFRGVQGMSGISVAEVTTAGATYGAFGALAAGNFTTKVRLAFYNRKQVPFIFIIVGLLVFDAVLNSGVSSAGSGVIIHAVVYPFVLAGIVVGLAWAGLNRFGVRKKSRQAAVRSAVAADAVEAVEAEAQRADLAELVEAEIALAPAGADEIVASLAEAPSARENAAVPEADTRQSEAAFFPLAIDRDEAVVPSPGEGDAEGGEADRLEPAGMQSFESPHYASGAENESSGGVLVEEPVAAPAREESTAAVAEPRPPAAEAKKPAAKQAASDDWLSGHLDLLNKLK